MTTFARTKDPKKKTPSRKGPDSAASKPTKKRAAKKSSAKGFRSREQYKPRAMAKRPSAKGSRGGRGTTELKPSSLRKMLLDLETKRRRNV